MKTKYLVLVHGENYLFRDGDGAIKKGFYVTRCVEASDPQEAETIAIDMLREDKNLTDILNDDSDTPWLTVEEIGSGPSPCRGHRWDHAADGRAGSLRRRTRRGGSGRRLARAGPGRGGPRLRGGPGHRRAPRGKGKQ